MALSTDTSLYVQYAPACVPLLSCVAIFAINCNFINTDKGTDGYKDLYINTNTNEHRHLDGLVFVAESDSAKICQIVQRDIIAEIVQRDIVIASQNNFCVFRSNIISIAVSIDSFCREGSLMGRGSLSTYNFRVECRNRGLRKG